MRTLDPTRDFLRVADKFFPSFVFADPDLSSGATLLYLYLFFIGRMHGESVSPSQECLARACKCSVRALQGYLGQLEAHGYIHIEHKQTGCNSYALLLSPHVQFLLDRAGIDLVFQNACVSEGAKSAPPTAQTLRSGHAESAPFIRDPRDQDPPLSPHPSPALSAQRIPQATSASRTRRRTTSLPPGDEGRGDSFARSFDAAGGFERLFTAWPVKKDKVVASRIFTSLVRTGQMPGLSVLLTAVERMKALDKHWKNGCAPTLTNWLRGQRWLDEPYQPDIVEIQSSSVIPNPVSMEIQNHVRALHQKFGSTVFSNADTPVATPPATVTPLVQELTSTAAALCALWPESPLQLVMTGLFLERQKGTDIQSLVTQARTYMRSVAKPLPILEWLKIREDCCV